MWILTATEIGSDHAVRVLRSAGVHSVTDILDTAELSLSDLKAMDSEAVVDRFCDKCANLKRFGSLSKKRLSKFLKDNRNTILNAYFVSAYSAPDEDSEVAEDEDFTPDLGDALPPETLLINVSVVKGGVECACIEDVIADIEQEILVSEGDMEEDDLRALVLEAIRIDEWPTDRPIFISEYAAKVYPEIAVALTRAATLVLK